MEPLPVDHICNYYIFQYKRQIHHRHYLHQRLLLCKILVNLSYLQTLDLLVVWKRGKKNPKSLMLYNGVTIKSKWSQGETERYNINDLSLQAEMHKMTLFTLTVGQQYSHVLLDTQHRLLYPLPPREAPSLSSDSLKSTVRPYSQLHVFHVHHSYASGNHWTGFP